MVYINAICNKCNKCIGLSFDADHETCKDLKDYMKAGGWTIEDKQGSKELVMLCSDCACLIPPSPTPP